MKPLRFCMVTTFYPPYHFGGDAMHVYRLSEALAQRGHQVHVIHSVDAYRLQHPGEPEIPFAHHANVTRHGLVSRRPALAALAAHQLGRPALYAERLEALLRGPYDVIHFHNVSLVGGPGVLALGRAAKLYTAHEYWLICPTHVLFRFDREACARRSCLACTVLYYRRPPQAWRWTGALAASLRHVDAVLFPSRFALEQHRAQGIARPLVHLPYLVPDAPGGASPEPEGLPQRPFFACVGRIEKLKGIQELLGLFARYRDADLLVVGSGGYRAELERQAQGLPHVRFLGAIHPSLLPAVYRRAIAIVVPSLCYETFGLTAAEGMSHGTPAIVRRIGALAENLEQSGGGLAFSTLEECRDAMERLRTDPALRDELGRRGRQAVARYWSVDAHLAQYLELVGGLVARRAGRSVPDRENAHALAAG